MLVCKKTYLLDISVSFSEFGWIWVTWVSFRLSTEAVNGFINVQYRNSNIIIGFMILKNTSMSIYRLRATLICYLCSFNRFGTFWYHLEPFWRQWRHKTGCNLKMLYFWYHHCLLRLKKHTYTKFQVRHFIISRYIEFSVNSQFWEFYPGAQYQTPQKKHFAHTFWHHSVPKSIALCEYKSIKTSLGSFFEGSLQKWQFGTGLITTRS